VHPTFPSGISVYQQAFTNWSGEIVLDSTWACTPSSPADVATLTNWAYAKGWKLRARGMGHGWSPLLEPNGTAGNILMVDTTQHLTAVTVNSGPPASITAQCGVTMLNLLTALEGSSYGLTNTPAPDDLTLGGVLAIDGHGTSVPANGESPTAGHTYGSVSNLVTALTAVVWDSGSSSYVLKTFQHSDPDIGAFLVNLGRAFVTEALFESAPTCGCAASAPTPRRSPTCSHRRPRPAPTPSPRWSTRAGGWRRSGSPSPRCRGSRCGR
jgi:FAD/FMN-containing dehydrogenase